MAGPLLDDATLAEMRDIQESNMPSEADLIGFSTSRDPGGVTLRTPYIAATVKCRVTLVGAAVVVLAQQFTPTADFVLYLPMGTSTTGITRLTVRIVDQLGTLITREMNVSGTPEPRSYAASRHIYAKLATDTLVPPPAIGTVIITETP
ncbi:MAG: hypothetical protein ABI119_05985 [Gemmatimonadaceae bacterium]